MLEGKYLLNQGNTMSLFVQYMKVIPEIRAKHSILVL